MVPVLSVVGYSNSGKTRVASYLVGSLVAQGYRLGAIKHCHQMHEMDKPGSDTSLLFGSGATAVIASSPGQRTRIERVCGEASLGNLVEEFGKDVDLIVAEGFKDGDAAKVLVVRDGGPAPEVSNVIAVVGDSPEHLGVPHVSMDNVSELVSLVKEKFLDQRSSQPQVALEVNGTDIPLKRYPSLVLSNLLMGFVGSLDGVPEEASEVRVRLVKA